MAFVIDNFLSDPMADREKALSATYQSIEHNGLNYRGISLTEDVEQCKKIETALGLPEGGEWTSFWRRNLSGEVNETYIHSDVLIGEYSGVLYLTKPEECKGGTAFWRHKLYGWDRHPSQEALAPLGLENTDELWQSVYKDGFKESKWEMTDYVPMDFNRMVLFASSRFHSRYPQESFGTELQNSRLIKVFFWKPGKTS